MNHVSRFKIVYIQAAVALASAVAGEFGPMKEMSHDQLHALTWVAWTLLAANIIVQVGNTAMASFQKAPEPKNDAPPPATLTLP